MRACVRVCVRACVRARAIERVSAVKDGSGGGGEGPKTHSERENLQDNTGNNIRGGKELTKLCEAH